MEAEEWRVLCHIVCTSSLLLLTNPAAPGVWEFNFQGHCSGLCVCFVRAAGIAACASCVCTSKCEFLF
jgi:hypothetical protein